MVSIYAILGIVLIGSGILGIWKKWLWLFQGKYERAVDQKKYCTYMGVISIIMGIAGIVMAILAYYDKESLLINCLIVVIFLGLAVYGEKKYRIKKEL